MKENGGPSVTNSIEQNCSKLVIDILPKININPQQVRWFECQNTDGEEECVETSKLELDWEGLLSTPAQ